LHTYKLGMFKEVSVPQGDGVLFGHEFAGDVVEIGAKSGIEGLKVGDRAVGMALGAYAEYCNVPPIITPTPMVYKLPDEVSYEEAATLEPLCVSYATVDRAELQGGERVLITGAGMIGLGCVQIIKARYPDCEVIVSDVTENRLEMAKQFGASRTINAREEDVVASLKESYGEEYVLYGTATAGNVDVAIEASGLGVPLNQAVEVVRQQGRLVVVALYEEMPNFDMNQVVSKNLIVSGVLAYTEDQIKAALDLIATGQVDRKALITHRYALADAAEAFESQIKTSETLKAVIKP